MGAPFVLHGQTVWRVAWWNEIDRIAEGALFADVSRGLLRG